MYARTRTHAQLIARSRAHTRTQADTAGLPVGHSVTTANQSPRRSDSFIGSSHPHADARLAAEDKSMAKKLSRGATMRSVLHALAAHSLMRACA
jgi:hypothetical protein